MCCCVWWLYSNNKWRTQKLPAEVKSYTKTPLMTDGAGTGAYSCQYSMKEREKLFN